MPHIYSDVHKLEGKPVIGKGDCVALVQEFTDVGWTGSWRPWVRVIDAGYIRVGTVIATFDEHGRYPNKPTGNHAGFSLEWVRLIARRAGRSTSSSWSSGSG